MIFFNNLKNIFHSLQQFPLLIRRVSKKKKSPSSSGCVLRSCHLGKRSHLLGITFGWRFPLSPCFRPWSFLLSSCSTRKGKVGVRRRNGVNRGPMVRGVVGDFKKMARGIFCSCFVDPREKRKQWGIFF